MFRRIFGRQPDDTPVENPNRLSPEEIEKIGTKDDPLLYYEAGLERNFAAMAAERRGDVDNAIELYEINVAGGFVGSHPYERLATIYELRNAPDEAVRVLTAFVQLAESETLPRGAQRSADRKLSGIQSRLHRLRASAKDDR